MKEYLFKLNIPINVTFKANSNDDSFTVLHHYEKYIKNLIEKETFKYFIGQGKVINDEEIN